MTPFQIPGNFGEMIETFGKSAVPEVYQDKIGKVYIAARERSGPKTFERTVLLTVGYHAKYIGPFITTVSCWIQTLGFENGDVLWTYLGLIEIDQYPTEQTAIDNLWKYHLAVFQNDYHLDTQYNT